MYGENVIGPNPVYSILNTNFARILAFSYSACMPLSPTLSQTFISHFFFHHSHTLPLLTSGGVTKLANNLALAISMIGTSEALNLVRDYSRLIIA